MEKYKGIFVGVNITEIYTVKHIIAPHRVYDEDNIDNIVDTEVEIRVITVGSYCSKKPIDEITTAAQAKNFIVDLGAKRIFDSWHISLFDMDGDVFIGLACDSTQNGVIQSIDIEYIHLQMERCRKQLMSIFGMYRKINLYIV